MTGSVHAKHGKWHTVVNSTDNRGARKQVWRSTGIAVPKEGTKKFEKSKEEARVALNMLLVQNMEKTYTESCNTPFCDYICEWVDISKARVQPTTWDVYKHMTDKHIYPYFKQAGTLLGNVPRGIIRKYYADKQAEGLSANTVIKHHSILRSVLQQAFEDGMVAENACDFVKKPKRKKYIGNYYTADEIKTLLTVTKGSTIEVVIYIAVHFGLRRSEIIGLRWNAIDFSDKTLTVKHKGTRATVAGKLTTILSDDLKTDASYRILPLSDEMVSYLEAVKHKQEENRERNGNSHNHKYNDYICVNELGDLIQPDYITDVFGKIIQRNNLKRIRFHDLRHSCASLLLALGYSMKDIQEWLGHSNFQTTANLYSHLDPRNKRNMIQGISNALA
jgi:integrase